MNFTSHRAIAEYVGDFFLKPEALENFVQGSTLPDECDDIMVKVGATWKTRFGPYALCSLTHFAGVSEGRIYGYCFGHDGAIAEVGLGIGEIKTRLALDPGSRVWRWKKIPHPLDEILRLKGVNSKKLSTITFPSSAAMCRHYQRLMEVDTLEADVFHRLLGCAAHMAMDACVPQHVMCTLGKGHAAFEGEIDDLIRAKGSAVLHQAWKASGESARSIAKYDFDDLYSMIQFAAERTLASGASVTPYVALVNGMGWTAALCRSQYGQFAGPTT